MAAKADAVSRALAELEAAQQALINALRHGLDDELPELVARVDLLERRRDSLIRRRLAAPTPSSFEQVSVRERVLATLQVAQRPISGRLVAEIARARFGYEIESRNLASLRRDELRSWRSYEGHPERGYAKPELIVPALSHDRLTPARGMLALSSWGLSTRIVAPASGRVDVLMVAVNLSRQYLAAPSAPWSAAVARLAARIGSSLPAFANRFAQPTPADIIAAAEGELQVIAGRDREERDEAADRATERRTGGARELSAEELLFGVAPMASISANGVRRVS